MAKASPHICPRQAANPHSAGCDASLGPSFSTPQCGYSIVQGLLYCHAIDDFWLPCCPLLLDFDSDYRPLVRNIKRARRLLLRELRQTISPRRKRQIRDQREVLSDVLLLFFGPLAEMTEEDAQEVVH